MLGSSMDSVALLLFGMCTFQDTPVPLPLKRRKFASGAGRHQIRQSEYFPDSKNLTALDNVDPKLYVFHIMQRMKAEVPVWSRSAYYW